MQLCVLFALSLWIAIASNWVICSSSRSNRDGGEGEGTKGTGKWRMVVENSGVSAMHMALLPGANRVIIFDRTDFGPSNITLGGGFCRKDPQDIALPIDCFAHSILYDATVNAFRPLTLLTDTWCSSGGLDATGRLVQTGGFNDGSRNVRLFTDSQAQSDWKELAGVLSVDRWYASNQILPDNRFIVVGGRQQFNYEFIPKSGSAMSTTASLPFLQETLDESENNLYPFLHLSSDGNLFIFANKDSILLDYKADKVVKRFPTMPGGYAHNYPSTGSSAMLPLRASDGFHKVEILICGGALPGSDRQAFSGVFLHAYGYCGRMVITDPFPAWQMEAMPYARVMGDMLLLPNAEVLLINGAQRGTAGWGAARDPAFWPVLYKPEQKYGARFRLLSRSSVPRMYHSTAILLPDTRILVGGGNPHMNYNFTDGEYSTQISLEAFAPPYLSAEYDSVRPKIAGFSASSMGYNSTFYVDFTVDSLESGQQFEITILAPAFATHSFSMNQRLLILDVHAIRPMQSGTIRAYVYAPPTAIVAPPGYYLLFVLQNQIPSHGSWIRFSY